LTDFLIDFLRSVSSDYGIDPRLLVVFFVRLCGWLHRSPCALEVFGNPGGVDSAIHVSAKELVEFYGMHPEAADSLVYTLAQRCGELEPSEVEKLCVSLPKLVEEVLSSAQR